MKYLFFLSILLLGNLSLLGQSPSQHEINLEKYYKGGAKAFLLKIYKSINYPNKARINCIVGKLNTKVAINEEGLVEKVVLINTLGYAIDNEVIRVLKKTSGNWKKGQSVILPMSFGFRLEGIYADCGADLITTGFGAGYKQNCATKEEIESYLNQNIKKKKVKRALKFCDELLRRYPDNQKYKAIRLGLLESD